MVEKIYCTETAKYIRLRAQRCQKYASHGKKLKIKVVWNWISSKKVRKRVSLSPPGVELGGFKDQYVWNLIMYRNVNLGSLYGSALLKIRISKKASNKSCLELNFVQKSSWAHISISPRSGDRGLQRSVCLKSYNVQKLEISFTLGLNAAKNTHFMKKKFK